MCIRDSRIREARERLRVSQASLLPSADASAGWSLSPDRGFRSSTSQDFTLGAYPSWELDLFGGNRRSIAAYRASLMSTEASAGDVYKRQAGACFPDGPS